MMYDYLFPECLEPASRVISRWKNGNYYKGEIDSITNRVNVLFDNGARLAYNPRDNVDIVIDRIPDHNEVPWGSQIIVNRPRSRAFEIGYIWDIKNGRFVILYENGDEILHTLDQIRVFNKSRICGKCKQHEKLFDVVEHILPSPVANTVINSPGLQTKRLSNPVISIHTFGRLMLSSTETF